MRPGLEVITVHDSDCFVVSGGELVPTFSKGQELVATDAETKSETRYRVHSFDPSTGQLYVEKVGLSDDDYARLIDAIRKLLAEHAPADAR